MVELKIIRNRSKLLKIKKDWGLLFAQQEEPWFFLEWIWFDTFWTEMDLSGWSVFILTAWESGKLIGTAPLMKKEKQFLGINYSIISGLENVHSQSYNWLLPVESQKKQAVIQTFINQISAMTANRYLLTWENAYTDHSATKDSKRILIREGLIVDSLPLRFPLTFSFLRNTNPILSYVSKNMRKRIRRNWRKLNNMGKVVFKEISTSLNLIDHLNSAWELELNTWKGEAGTAIAQDVALKNFYNNLAIKAKLSGKLAMFMLWCDEELVAFLYTVCDEQVIHELKGSYNPKFAKYSPGYLLDWKIFEWAQIRGFNKVNMCGEADDYKKHWGNEQAEVSTIRVFSPGLFGKLLYLTCFAWKNKLRKMPVLKRIKKVFDNK